MNQEIPLEPETEIERDVPQEDVEIEEIEPASDDDSVIEEDEDATSDDEDEYDDEDDDEDDDDDDDDDLPVEDEAVV
jgi:hypothetical protein